MVRDRRRGHQALEAMARQLNGRPRRAYESSKRGFMTEHVILRAGSSQLAGVLFGVLQ